MDYMEATLLSLDEKLPLLNGSDRQLLDNIANHMLMTYELLHNTKHLKYNQTPGFWADDVPAQEYVDYQ